MAKILISWIATVHDFTLDQSVNSLGPNSLVHKYLFAGYEKHVLLTTYKEPSSDTKFQMLCNYLRRHYKHEIEECGLGIKKEDIINLSALSLAVNEMLLTRYKFDEIDIFISPGTPAMQAAWYLACIGLGLDIKLFQTVSPEKNIGKLPAKLFVTPDQIGYVSALMRKEANLFKVENATDKVVPKILSQVYSKATKIALSDVGVLITGATGTGKELIAKHIHDSSHRRNNAFVAINCSAFGNDLLESRLFGHKKGAFTGAMQNTSGFFRDAHGGTIFLDEIGDISPYMQQTLLRVLADHQITRVGETTSEKINVRVIAATNKDLYILSAQNQFRSDLYYRLATTEIQLPPLNAYSVTDKDQLFQFLWMKAKRSLGLKHDIRLPTSIKKVLMAYHYPGNIREMENLIFGLLAEAENEIKHDMLPERIKSPSNLHSMKLNDIVLNHVRLVFEMTGGNVKRSVEILGISQNTLKSKLRR